MKAPGLSFQEYDVLHELKSYLPVQVPFGNFAPYTTPVSYTHLDVYKRQVLAGKRLNKVNSPLSS